LDKGLNFAVIPSCAPVLEILTDVESSIIYLSNVIKEDIRTNTKKIILEQRGTENYRRNRSSEKKEREIPKQLNSKDYMYVKADKSDHVVILDAEEYDKRMYPKELEFVAIIPILIEDFQFKGTRYAWLSKNPQTRG
jgi:hypothetical protein